VGYALPDDYGARFRMLMDRVPNIDRAVLSVHCHNDLGLAVANSLAGLANGARQVECTINGIGERAGNAALEEVVMAIRSRKDSLPYETGIDTTKITDISRALSTVTGFSVQPNKAIVGANAFAHESGIHQDGMLKNAQTYEIMTPASVGLVKSELVLGKHSGRHALKNKLLEMGVELGDNALNDLFARFKDLADQKKTVYDEDIAALIAELTGHAPDADRLQFVSLNVQAGSKAPPSAELTLKIAGKDQTATGQGTGPVDSIFKAIRMMAPHDKAALQLYQVNAVRGETDAPAEVTVRLEQGGQTFTGNSADPDTMIATCRAYLHALNKLQRAVSGG
jgi:2-isopropylmalate synthase